MDRDIKVKRAKYIDRTSEVRSKLSWANPCQILRAGDIYVGDHYGSNLWLLKSDAAESYFKAWNTFVKLSWDVPRSTHTYLVEHFLAKDFTPTRNQVLSRYVTFLHSLLNSPNREVRILARIVTQDYKSVTRQNIDYIHERSGLSPLNYGKSRIQIELPKSELSENNLWRISLLAKLLEKRQIQTTAAEDIRPTQIWIDSLCST